MATVTGRGTFLRRGGSAAALLGLLVTLAACGGGDSGSLDNGLATVPQPLTGEVVAEAPDPFALDRALLEAAQELDRAGRPVLSCLDDPGCEVLSMPEEAKRYERAINRAVKDLEVALIVQPDGCLVEAAEARLREYAALREVASPGTELSAWQAAARANEAVVDASYASASCSPFSGANARFYSAAGFEVANAQRRLVFRVARCSDTACRAREGAALARTAASAIRELRPGLERVGDRCARDLSALSLDGLDAYRRLGAALQHKSDEEVARADADLRQIGSTATDLYLGCLDDPALGAREGSS